MSKFCPRNDIDEFISKVFECDFNCATDQYIIIHNVPRPPFAWNEYIYKIQNSFYHIDDNRARFLLIPIESGRIITVDEQDKAVYVHNANKEDQEKEMSGAINLSKEWIKFKCLKKPDLIDEYIQTYSNEISSLERQKENIQKEIDYNKQIICEINSLRNKEDSQDKQIL